MGAIQHRAWLESAASPAQCRSGLSLGCGLKTGAEEATGLLDQQIKISLWRRSTEEGIFFFFLNPGV